MKYKNVGVRSTHAYYSNPSVGQGTFFVKYQEGYKTDGLEITSDHKHIQVQSYDLELKYPMKAVVCLKPNFFQIVLNILSGKYWLRSKYVEIKEKTTFLLKNVLSVGFSNDWDDSNYTFFPVKDKDVIPDNRTRKIFHKDQILKHSQLVRGKIVTYEHWHSGMEKTAPQKMLVLCGYSDQASRGYPVLKGLFLNEDGSTWEFWPALSDCSVIPYENGYYNNLSYLVDTGETMTEEEILVALSKNKNK